MTGYSPSPVMLEELHRAFVLLGLLARLECPQIAALACVRIHFPGI
jgi:hypothetical protein